MKIKRNSTSPHACKVKSGKRGKFTDNNQLFVDWCSGGLSVTVYHGKQCRMLRVIVPYDVLNKVIA